MSNAQMLILSLWSPKGGVGKSTLSVSLAGAFSEAGKKVMLLDLDEQETSYQLYKKNQVPWQARRGIPKTKPNVDVLIMDHPPGHLKAPQNGLVILPMQASEEDYNSFRMGSKLIEGRKFIPVVNAMDKRVGEEKEFGRLMAAQGASIVRRRTVFRKAYAGGVTIFQWGSKDKAKEAREDIRNLMMRCAA